MRDRERDNITPINDIMFFCCIWSVKLAFLLFYKNLFGVSQRFMKAWWCVLVFTVLTFWVCLGTTFAQCGGDASDLLNLDVCKSSFSLHLQLKFFKINFAMNIASDAAIMALPLAMLPSLQMQKTQKYGVGMIFCLSLIVAAFELLRTIESLKGTVTSLNTLWVSLEAAVAVIVSCLPSFNTIFWYTKRHNISKRSSSYDRINASGLNGRSAQSAKSNNLTEASTDKASQDIPMDAFENFNEA